MAFCFMTIEKIKDAGTMVRKYEHNYRTERVPNAIPELRSLNDELVQLKTREGNDCSYLDAYKERIQSLDYYRTHKVRKDAVKALEVITTFSRTEKPENMNLEQWKKDNVQWLKDTFNKDPENYGDNVLSVMYHGDENGNVHCHAFVVPIDEHGHLNAHSYTGGRAAMTRLQDSYAKAMKIHGLERGIKGSSAKHQDIKKFYARLNQKLDVPRPAPGESAIEYRERILSLIQTERATMLREFMEKETRMQQKFDSQRNRERAAMMGAVEAKGAHMQVRLKEMEQEGEEIRRKNAALRKETDELELRIVQEQQYYQEVQEKAQKVIKLAEDVGNVAEKAQAYDDLQAAIQFAGNEIPDFTEKFKRDMDVIQNLYEEREVDK